MNKTKIFYGIIGVIVVALLGFFLFYEKHEPEPEVITVESYETMAKDIYNTFVENSGFEDITLLEVQGCVTDGVISQFNEIVAIKDTCYSVTRFSGDDAIVSNVLAGVDSNMDKTLVFDNLIGAKAACDTLMNNEVVLPEHTIIILRSPSDEKEIWYYFSTEEKSIAKVNANDGKFEIYK